MQLLRDKRASIWSAIVDMISLKQLEQTMGSDFRTWRSKAARIKQVSKAQKVHALADQLVAECARIAEQFTWFQGLPYERTTLVLTLIQAHVVATHEYDHEAAEDIEEMLFELRMAPTREEQAVSRG